MLDTDGWYFRPAITRPCLIFCTLSLKKPENLLLSTFVEGKAGMTGGTLQLCSFGISTAKLIIVIFTLLGIIKLADKVHLNNKL